LWASGEEIEAYTYPDEIGDLESGEIAVAWTIQVSRKEALEGPDAVKWLEASSLERAQLEALETWRPVNSSDAIVEVIPSALIYTRKRCGRYKARLVALGNRQRVHGSEEIFSPTISAPGNRAVLIDAAANGHAVCMFDISNAFCRVVLKPDQNITMRLPPEWGGQKVRLLKSLYGLKLSPRAWFDTYRTFLEENGWEMCVGEPGMFRKRQMRMSVYVDDSFIAGPDSEEIAREVETVLQKFPGKIILPEISHDAGGARVETFDVIGMNVVYCRERKDLKIDMAPAIGKLVEQYGQGDAKSVSSPATREFDPGEFVEGEVKFPLRELVGSLLYIASSCRPDIAFATQRVARFVSKPTKQVIAEAKRILRYLRGTPETGLHYSPEREATFHEECKKTA